MIDENFLYEFVSCLPVYREGGSGINLKRNEDNRYNI